ncbi:MAG: adaptor protein MecA [Lactobacillus sp.]|nr:adaptor protein MecA [Lactobacillus sp.]MCH3906619.1 adaptor protein MecA [Lactobacillus sp.]MCH3989745.1 adaptor protein MecA [Lactobacillus sp.]MCH4068089.1 adaptor protein MecA [Lactobacillus sp.]MCI1303955.1 adaptor protein MecA [Lactobacillus sp.]
MQVDRINQNTLRVRMDAAELKKRGITMLDLLGNKSDIQKFFYSILEEVDKDHLFAGTDAVTFQVMPNGNGLELLISKVNGGAGAFNQQPAPAPVSTQAIVKDNRRVFKLASLEAVIALADSLQVQDLAASLYKSGRDYYLELAFLDDNYAEMKPQDAWAIANEFGEGMSDQEFTDIKTTAKCLLPQDALASLRSYFS